MPEPRYLPTPDQIRRECEKIRAEWTEQEREKRTVRKERQWTPPTVGVSQPETE